VTLLLLPNISPAALQWRENMVIAAQYDCRRERCENPINRRAVTATYIYLQ
jgi:hypothetical protein